MKQIISLGMVAVLLLAGGCHKKSKKTALVEFDGNVDRSTYAFAENESEEIFNIEDFEELEAEFDAAELAFLDEAEFDLAEFEDLELAELEEEMLEWEEEQKQFVFDSISFAFNESGIAGGQRDVLEDVVEVAREAIDEGKTIIIQGHADQLGSDEANLRCSMKRAQAVKSEMVKYGLEGEKLEIVGYSNEMPLAFVDEEDDVEKEELKEILSPNRRVDFSVV